MPPVRLATVTLNATLDRVILLPDLVPGGIYDAQEVMTLAGGKGLNVARAALALGSEVMATGLIAGECGQWVQSLLQQEGIPGRLIDLPDGESRISTMIVDLQNRQTTVINDLGPSVHSASWVGLRARLSQAVVEYPWVVLTGSGLPGLPHSVYAELTIDIQARGQRVCLDARKQWLESALPARPYLVKCNQYEAAQVLGCEIDTPQHACQAVQTWTNLGVERIVLTMGQQGAVAIEGNNTWYVRAPVVDALYPIGSGDAMLAGLIVALDREEPFPQAVQYGVALGAANTLVPGSGRCDMAALPYLLCQTTIQAL